MNKLYSKAFLFAALGVGTLFQQQPAAAQGMFHPGSPFGTFSPLNSIMYGDSDADRRRREEEEDTRRRNDEEDHERRRRQEREAEDDAYRQTPEYRQSVREEEAAEREALRAARQAEIRLLHALVSPSVKAEDVVSIVQDNDLPNYPDFRADDAVCLSQAREAVLGKTFKGAATAAQAGAIIDSMHDLHAEEIERQNAEYLRAQEALRREQTLTAITTALYARAGNVEKLTKALYEHNVTNGLLAADSVIYDVARKYLQDVTDPVQNPAALDGLKKIDSLQAQEKKTATLEWEGAGGALVLGAYVGFMALRRRREMQPS